jgi:hypothetical protein
VRHAVAGAAAGPASEAGTATAAAHSSAGTAAIRPAADHSAGLAASAGRRAAAKSAEESGCTRPGSREGDPGAAARHAATVAGLPGDVAAGRCLAAASPAMPATDPIPAPLVAFSAAMNVIPFDKERHGAETPGVQESSVVANLRSNVRTHTLASRHVPSVAGIVRRSDSRPPSQTIGSAHNFPSKFL